MTMPKMLPTALMTCSFAPSCEQRKATESGVSASAAFARKARATCGAGICEAASRRPASPTQLLSAQTASVRTTQLSNASPPRLVSLTGLAPSLAATFCLPSAASTRPTQMMTDDVMEYAAKPR